MPACPQLCASSSQLGLGYLAINSRDGGVLATCNFNFNVNFYSNLNYYVILNISSILNTLYEDSMHFYQLRELLIIHNLFINEYQDSRTWNFSIVLSKENLACSGVPGLQAMQHTQRRVKHGCPT